MDIDKAILILLSDRGSPQATYVVKNGLSLWHKIHRETAAVRRRLRSLQAHGMVEVVPTSYRTMLSWRITDQGRVFLASLQSDEAA